MKWSAALITKFLVRHTFNRGVLAVPNCMWPGSECDLLVVTKNLRIIDVEIKISRSDLKADVDKDKWYHAWDWQKDGPWKPASADRPPRRRRDWPRRVWKHYYCMPLDVWKPEFAAIISPASGVLVVKEHDNFDGFVVRCERQAKPCRDADKISAEQAIDVARLAGLRMWDALAALEQSRAGAATT